MTGLFVKMSEQMNDCVQLTEREREIIGKVGDVYSTAAPSRLREGEWVDLSALWRKKFENLKLYKTFAFSKSWDDDGDEEENNVNWTNASHREIIQGQEWWDECVVVVRCLLYCCSQRTERGRVSGPLASGGRGVGMGYPDSVRCEEKIFFFFFTQPEWDIRSCSTGDHSFIRRGSYAKVVSISVCCLCEEYIYIYFIYAYI